MPTTSICDQLRAWAERYPDPLASAGRNAASRADEDKRLGRFAGLDALERDSALAVVCTTS
jgi:hypothetical protein